MQFSSAISVSFTPGVDTPIGFFAYLAFAIELLAILIVSNSATSFRSLSYGHLASACAAAAALLLLLLVALSAWTAHPATLIVGIQGRYFYPIALLFLFACWMGPPLQDVDHPLVRNPSCYGRFLG